MRQYECECILCQSKRQTAFSKEPYPEFGEIFFAWCSECGAETDHTRVLTRKTAAEFRRRADEQSLRDLITACCESYDMTCRFLYQSVVVTTTLSDWCFDYHESRITLYHESTIKINFQTGAYAKAHVQFQNRRIIPQEVIEYISAHDVWKEKNR